MEHEVGREILRQMGGTMLLAMTGSGATLVDNGLILTLKRNRLKAQYLEVWLNGADLYDMRFVRTKNGEPVTIKEFYDVYYDQLRDIFERETGFATRMGAIYNLNTGAVLQFN